jgi:hypothetical protein
VSQSGILKISDSSLPPDVPTSFIANVGVATPALNILNIVGSGTISTSAVGSTLTITNTNAFPFTVPQGGTGNIAFTPYAVICAGTTAAAALQNVSGVGTADQVLVSNGPGALPSWQSSVQLKIDYTLPFLFGGM